MSRSNPEFNRYRALVSHHAQAALATAGEQARAPGHASSASLTLALPVACVVAGGQAREETHTTNESLERALARLTDGSRRLVTLTGQSRAVYWPLAVHLLLRALALRGAGDTVSAATLRDVLTPGELRRDTVALVLWEQLCRWEAATLLDDAPLRESAAQQVDAVIAAMPDDGALHTRTVDDQLDHWTYRELSGLHALTNLAWQAQREAWWAAAHRVVSFHLEHTQPDYTTYEPWAIHAFLSWREASVFADQQLHDMQTNLHVSGPSAALLPALLLADAAGALADPAFAASA